MKKKTLALLMCAVLIFSILPMTGGAAGSVKYLAYNAESGNYTEQECSAYSSVSGETTVWTGWLFAEGNAAILRNVTLAGDTNLILGDGAAVTVSGTVSCGNYALNIYAQSGGTGTLTVNGANGVASDDATEPANGSAAVIGSITVNGGSVSLKGGNGVDCINVSEYGTDGSSGADGLNGSITVNGGNVRIEGGNGGEGGGYSPDNGGNGAPALTGDVIVNVGTVELLGGNLGWGGAIYGGESDAGITAENGMEASALSASGTLTTNGSIQTSNLGWREQYADWNGTTLNNYRGIKVTAELPAPEGPTVIVGCDVEEEDVKYPGDTITVTLAAENAASYSADVILTYDTALVELTAISCDFRYEETAGSVHIIAADLQTEDLATVTFTVKEITADDEAVFALTKYKFATGEAAMSADAVDAKLDPGSVTVSLSAGHLVKFLDAENKEIAAATKTVKHGEAAVAPSPAPSKVGHTFSGWAVQGSTDVVDLADTPITAATTFVPVFALDITVTQDADYIGGYVRVVVTGALDNYNYNGNAMYKLADGTFAYLYAATKETALSDAAAKALVTVNAAAPAEDHDLSGRSFDVNGTGVFDTADLRAVFNCANADKEAFAEFPYIDFIATCLRADVAKADGETSAKVDATDVNAVIEALFAQ